MGKLDGRGGIAIAELIVYSPCLLVSVFLCAKFGFQRASGWIYTVIFCLARIIGSGFQLSTYSNPSVSSYTGAFILNGIALSPLLLATLGILSRFIDWTRANAGSPVNASHVRIIQIILLVGLILGIVGGTSTNFSADGTYQPQPTTQASTILYLLGLIAIAAVLLLSRRSFNEAPRGERRIFIAITLALPILFIRIIYSILSAFLHNKTFSMLRGSLGAYIGMAVIEEFVVIAIYLTLGFMLEKSVPERSETLAGNQRNWKNPRSGYGRRRPGLIGLAMSAFEGRNDYREPEQAMSARH